jgi:hypothetical protein
MAKDKYMICAGIEKCEIKYDGLSGCKRHNKVHRIQPDCNIKCVDDAVCRKATVAEIVMAKMLGEI